MKLTRPGSQVEVSAGGLVMSAENPELVALISHRNRGGKADWVIPKGHVERGEDLAQTAVREVAEETGILAEVVEKLGEITYTFKIGPQRIKKTVHHYLLRQVGGELSGEHDPAGEVLDAQWFPLSEVENVLAHENERRVAQQALERLS
jgi:8-oxo-dGTP pyrophosphatase MutT (NUDIX family)